MSARAIEIVSGLRRSLLSTQTAGEPDDTRVSPGTRSARANSSFNDEFVMVPKPFQQSLTGTTEIDPPEPADRNIFALDVDTEQRDPAALVSDGRHNPQRAGRRPNEDRGDRPLRRSLVEADTDVGSAP